MFDDVVQTRVWLSDEPCLYALSVYDGDLCGFEVRFCVSVVACWTEFVRRFVEYVDAS